ncbi:MAG: hypothetical protein V4642_10705 [Bacteroidota bacterium]
MEFLKSFKKLDFKKKVIYVTVVFAVIIAACSGKKKPGQIVPLTPEQDSIITKDSVQKPKVTDDDLKYLDSLVTTPEQAKKALDDTLKADFKGTVGIIKNHAPQIQPLLLKDVRTGTHGGFDRVVFEFNGSTMPGYELEYIDKPVRQCGSGNVVQMAGDGWLRVKFTPVNAHTEAGKPTVLKREIYPKYPNMIDIKSICDFEAEVAWVIGVKSPKQYRVLELLNPTRVVVDVKQ